MMRFDKFALILVCQWISVVFSALSHVFKTNAYTEGQSGPCLGDGGGWSSRLPALAAELPGRKRKQGQSSSQQAIDMLLP